MSDIRYEVARHASVENTSWQTDPGPSGWFGWIAFAGTMVLLLGSFPVILGVIAPFQDEYYLVGANGLTVQLDYTPWGWTHVILGLALATLVVARAVNIF